MVIQNNEFRLKILCCSFYFYGSISKQLFTKTPVGSWFLLLALFKMVNVQSRHRQLVYHDLCLVLQNLPVRVNLVLRRFFYPA